MLRLLEALARAKEYDKANFPIFFHCNSGMHRAPTLALAFLARVKGMREAEADPWLIFCKLLFANFFVWVFWGFVCLMSVVFLFAFFAHVWGRIDQVAQVDGAVHGTARESKVSCLQDIVDIMTPSVACQAYLVFFLVPLCSKARFKIMNWIERWKKEAAPSCWLQFLCEEFLLCDLLFLFPLKRIKLLWIVLCLTGVPWRIRRRLNDFLNFHCKLFLLCGCCFLCIAVH